MIKYGSQRHVIAEGKCIQSNLPDGYTQCQYIWMKQDSYLLTDIIPTYDGHYELDFQTTVYNNAAAYLGGRAGETPAGLTFSHGNGGSTVTDAFGQRYNLAYVVKNNTRYKYVFNNNVFTLYENGIEVETYTFTSTNNSGAALAIKAINTAGNIQFTNEGIYFYGFKAWNNQGQLIADYVPAIKKAAIPIVGFYDMVSKTFKSATAGTFIAGDNVVPTPDNPIDIVCNNGVLKVNFETGQIYTEGTPETITDSISNVATCQNLLSVGQYKDKQSILDGVVTRNVGIKVLNGNEDWQGFDGDIYYINIPQLIGATSYVGLSNYFKCTNTSIGQQGKFHFGGTIINGNVIFTVDHTWPTKNAFKTWLSDQYAAGTPVIIVYPLATAITESVAPQELSDEGTIVQTDGSIMGLDIKDIRDKVLVGRYITDNDGIAKKIVKVYIGDNQIAEIS